MSSMQDLMERLYSGDDLSQHEAEDTVSKIIAGELSDIEITALLIALKCKGESSEEIAGAAAALRKAALPFTQPQGTLVDTCGTGGDNSGTINISTIVGLVAAECGVKVVKHGNRSVSSSSGSSDVLQKFGLKLDPEPKVAEKCLVDENFCFLFAPKYHSGVRHVMPVRTALKTRTLFNLIGPLANPAFPQVQLMGVYDPNRLESMAKALGQLGCKRALVVNGGGLDEIALHCETKAAYLNNGKIELIEITPEQAGVARAPLESLQINDPVEIANALTAVIEGRGQTEHVDAIALNTAAVLWLDNKAADLAEGVTIARDAIVSGKVKQRLERIVELSNGR